MQHSLRTLLIAVLMLLCGFATAQADPDPVTRGEFTYYFDHPYYLEMADTVLSRTKGRLTDLLGTRPEFPIEVHLVADQDRFDSLIGGHFPDWGAAAAIPYYSRIVIKSPDSFTLNRPLAELLRHEYAHLALARRVGLGKPPRWFDEGFAMVVSMQWSWSENLAMNLASVTGDLVPLREIEGVNQFGEAKARVAYAQSYLTVQYLFDTYGREGVSLFLEALGRNASIDEALIAATGSNYADFEEEIRVYLLSRFNLVGLVSDTMYLWLGLAVVVIIGFILSIRRRKKYYKQWEEAEQLHSTDFDYGDPDRPEEIDDDEPWRQ